MALTPWTLPSFADMLNKASSVVDEVMQTSSEFVQVGKNLYNEGASAVESKVEEAKYALWELTTAQAELDAKLDSMDAGPEKDALKAKRDSSRSFFADKVAPLAQKLGSDQQKYEAIMVDDVNKYSNFAGHTLGILPVVPVALGVGMAAVSAGIIYWAHEAYALERAILDDPNLKPGEKYKLALKAGENGILGSFTQMKWPLVIGGLSLVGLMLVLKRKA